jgi:hypothetical protein
VFTTLASSFTVVARPIQDMSAVSVTHKTVGNRLPRLWCGARLKSVTVDHLKRVSFRFLPLYTLGMRGWGVAEFSSLREKGARAEPMKRLTQESLTRKSL